jgi:hypothetical protein
MAAMIHLHTSGRSDGRGGRKMESLAYPHKKKYHMALGQAILVASEAAPVLLHDIQEIRI